MSENEATLAAHGLLFPRAGRFFESSYQVETHGGLRVVARAPMGHHQLLAWSMIGEVKDLSPDKPWQGLRDELDRASATLALVTAEALSRLSVEQVGRVQQYLTGHEVSIVYYLRGLRQRVISAYSYLVGNGRYGSSLQQFIGEREDVLLRDLTSLQNWISVFGSENVHVRPFEAVIRHTTLAADLLGLVGIPHDQIPKLTANASPSSDAVQISRRVNRACERLGVGHDSAIARQLRAVARSAPVRVLYGMLPNEPLDSPRIRSELRERSNSWYPRLVETHVSAEHRHLYDV